MGVDPFTLHIYAALAEQERRMISQRIIAGLSAAKTRGRKLGSSVSKLATKNAAAAAARDAALEPLLQDLPHPRALLRKRSSAVASASCLTRPSRALAFASGWRIDQ